MIRLWDKRPVWGDTREGDYIHSKLEQIHKNRAGFICRDNKEWFAPLHDIQGHSALIPGHCYILSLNFGEMGLIRGFSVVYDTTDKQWVNRYADDPRAIDVSYYIDQDFEIIT